MSETTHTNYLTLNDLPWGSFDWLHLNDAQMQRYIKATYDLTVSREYIRLKRIRLRKPKALTFNQPEDTVEKAILKAYRPYKTTKEIAEEVGSTDQYVCTVISGLPRRKDNRKHDWECINWNFRNHVLAKLLDEIPPVIARARRKYAPPHLKQSPRV